MSATSSFDYVCSTLESETELNRLETRGTIRIALKAAGLDAQHVTAEQLQVVTDRLLPDEFNARGIKNVDELCAKLKKGGDDMRISDSSSVFRTSDKSPKCQLASQRGDTLPLATEGGAAAGLTAVLSLALVRRRKRWRASPSSRLMAANR